MSTSLNETPRKRAGGGQDYCDTQKKLATTGKNAGHGEPDIHRPHASTGGDHYPCETQGNYVPTGISSRTPRKRAGGDQLTAETQLRRVLTGKNAGHGNADNHAHAASTGGGLDVAVTQKPRASTGTNLRTPRKRAGGQAVPDTQIASAPGENAGQVVRDTRADGASTGGDHHSGDTHTHPVPTGSLRKQAEARRLELHHSIANSADGQLFAAIGLIQRNHREYRGLQQAVGDMERRIKSEIRWAAISRVYPNGPPPDMKGFKFPDPIAADITAVKTLRARYYEGLKPLKLLQNDCFNNELLVAAQFLPALKFVEDTVGCGIASLIAIVAHAGDLSNYSNPGKLWKRFSLHVVNGAASRRIKGKDAAKAQQFVPVRRAEMHVIGENLMKAGGAYADLYRERKAYEITTLEARGIKVLPSSRIPKNSEGYMSQGQVHKRALRYIEKRLLRQLWRAWREAAHKVSPITTLPPVNSTEIVH